MERLGPAPGGWLVATISAHTLRVVGAVTVLLATGVASLSVTTEEGLAVSAGTGERSATVATDAGLVPAFVEFAVAHPAYPTVAAVGLVLVLLGDDAPLLGT